jgi:hypothetical protein
MQTFYDHFEESYFQRMAGRAGTSGRSIFRTLPQRRLNRWHINTAAHAASIMDATAYDRSVGHIGETIQVDALTLFGLIAVSAMLICYALEKRSHWFILAFAASCAMGSVYGFLQGAWPFGLVESIWSVVAARRWWIVTTRN